MNTVPDHILADILNYCREKQYRRVARQWCRIIDRFEPDTARPAKMSPVWFEKNPDRIEWIILSYRYSLSEEFIEKWAERVDWYHISWAQILSEEFIGKWSERVDWREISMSQTLSEEFIEKWADRVNLYLIIINQNISVKFADKLLEGVDWKQEWDAPDEESFYKLLKNRNNK